MNRPALPLRTPSDRSMKRQGTVDPHLKSRVMAKMRTWRPFDGEAVLDAVGDALDYVKPGDEEELAKLLHGHLAQLVMIAVANEAEERDTYAATLIRQARTLAQESVPAQRHEAVAHLRRLGWVTNELLDRLVETRRLKEAA
ncbi:DUF6415 family natural product biosynthesis protein [Streptomyces smyrnaeus]|uniref:DUF6415 family natural product biosynthesis protein n=1 Tax=Streptomyces smyrnaeus TaxID=1387713 RepID=UPI0033A6FC48